ncbi:MAG: hypothetical protein KGH76_06525 [Thaumarchaeota archaeon]|nr:hypothetical protein [Nitrososphaerota archaeon]
MSILHYSIIVILVIMMIIYTASTVEAQNSTNVTIPHNAIKTPNGGWITPLETTDENGRNLTMHYETGMPVSGKLNPGPPPDPLFLTDSRGNIDNFFTAHQILIRADVYPQSSARTATVEINMSSDTGFAFDDKKHLVFTPNATHVQQAIWQFLPTKAGNYTIEKISNGVHVSSVSFSVFDSKTGSKYPVVVSPLKQFRWGILPENIQCRDDFELIFKTDDDSPACVMSKTASNLGQRGWEIMTSLTTQKASMVQNTSTNVCGQFFTAPSGRNQSTVPVLLMKSNSTACTRLTYKIYSDYKNCNGQICQNMITFDTLHIGDLHYEKNDGSFSITPGKDYTNSFNITTIPGTVDLANYPVGTSFTVTYIIKPLPNATGFYDQSIPRLACESYPLAVGYAADKVNASSFSYIDQLNPPCVAGVYTLVGVEISGMTYKQVILPP